MCIGMFDENGVLEGKEQKEVTTVSGEKVPVDKCIAPLVQMLNDYGIVTRYSCCSHGIDLLSKISIEANHIEKRKLSDGSEVIWLCFPYKGN